MDTRKFLKVKVKSLAEEARIIRLEERRAKMRKQYDLLNELHSHRMNVVRPECRAAHMAYGLLRGLQPGQIEQSPKTPIQVKRVKTLMTQYRPKETTAVA